MGIETVGIKFWLDMIGVSFELILAYLFFRIFFDRWGLPKKAVALVFLVIFFIKFNGSYYLPEAWMRTALGLLCYLTIGCCYRGNFLQKIVMTVLFWSINVMVEYSVAGILQIIMGQLFAAPIHAVYERNLYDYALGLFLSKFIVMVFYSGVYYYQKQRKLQRGKTLSSQWYIAFLFYPLITVVLLVQNYYFIGGSIQHHLLGKFVLSGVLLIISNLIIFQIQSEMQRLQQEQLHSALILQQNQAQQAFYKESIEKNRQLKKLVHDEKNFLLGVVGYLKHNKVEQAIAELEQQVDQLVSNVTDYTGNIALDTVLSAKVDKARQHGITLRPAMALYGEVHVDFLDLVLILGNALDNAIEAASQVEVERRVIHLSMKLQDDFLLLEVRNPVLEHIAIQENHITTSKIDTALHGYGLDTMKRLTEKYHGSLQLECEGEMFMVKILLEN